MKTHYRKVFKSDHLSSYDLEDLEEQGKPLIFTIKHVKQEMQTKVAGKKIDANIAYFVENIKPLVLNATNSKIVANMCKSSFIDDWVNVPVELYIQKNISFGRERVEGVRIKEEPPKKLTTQEVQSYHQKIIALTSQADLNKFYSNLPANAKTNKDITTMLKDRQEQLKQA